MRCVECRVPHAKQRPKDIGSWLCEGCNTAHWEGINVRRALQSDDVVITNRNECEMKSDLTRLRRIVT